MAKGAVPSRMPFHWMMAAYPTASPVERSVNRATPWALLVARRTSTLLLLSTIPSITAWFGIGAPASS